MANTEPQDIFELLTSVDVKDRIEEKDTGKVKLKYLSWAWAWYEVRKRYPDATYTIVKNENNLPYFVDPGLGIMVYTTVTINNETHEMWLPVMDGANNPMRLEPYDITTKWGKKHVDAATMFDVNKTVMRCLTKNLAMFGLGLALYAGEDLFDEAEPDKKESTKKDAPKPTGTEQTAEDVDASTIIKQIDGIIKKITVDMSNEEKDALATKIKNVIGRVDYRKCTDVKALMTLVTTLNAA